MRRAAVIVIATLAASAATASAGEEVSKKVRSACKIDAKQLCPKDKFGSSELRYCMEANGRRLSRSCVQALEDDGVVPRGYFKG